jgi:hypothetical protein
MASDKSSFTRSGMVGDAMTVGHLQKGLTPANEGLTVGHLQKGLTTGHLQQALGGAQTSTPQTSTSTPAPAPAKPQK